MSDQLQEQIRTMSLGDHTCLIYDSLDEQMDAIVPYIKFGLERNEACVYISDDRSVEEIKDAFNNHGVDIESALASGQMVFATKRDAYLKSGSFDPVMMIDYLKELMLEALAKGFTGYRVTGEMTWALGSECGCNRLVEYEALLNDFFPGKKVSAICQYNRDRFAPEIIRDVLRTHPKAVLGNQVCTNLYYETPKMVLGEESAHQKVAWMISQLKTFRQTEQSLQHAVQSRDEFLSIASHELRTPLTSLKFQNDVQREELEEGKTILEGDELKDYIEMNHRQISVLSKLVDDMLDISRIQNG